MKDSKTNTRTAQMIRKLLLKFPYMPAPDISARSYGAAYELLKAHHIYKPLARPYRPAKALLTGGLDADLEKEIREYHESQAAAPKVATSAEIDAEDATHQEQQNDVTLTCELCEEEAPGNVGMKEDSNAIAQCENAHIFCADCVRRFVEAKLEEGGACFHCA
ncbi:hypothetical protein HDV00_002171 [Rhizophlyctis rosea]|nr:hypothetical protein HDV00_002171 [Rhizophlyctis rosea]